MEITINLENLNSYEASFVRDILGAHFIRFDIDSCGYGSCIVHFGNDVISGHITKRDIITSLYIGNGCEKTKNISGSIETLSVIFAHYVFWNGGICRHCTSGLHEGTYPYKE